MPALNGQVILTGTNIVIFESFDAATGALVDKTVTTSTGPKTGALVVDNMTGKTQTVTCTNEAGLVKTFSIPASGTVLTAAQLAANRQNNGGPLTDIADLTGITVVL